MTFNFSLAFNRNFKDYAFQVPFGRRVSLKRRKWPSTKKMVRENLLESVQYIKQMLIACSAKLLIFRNRDIITPRDTYLELNSTETARSSLTLPTTDETSLYLASTSKQDFIVSTKVQAISIPSIFYGLLTNNKCWAILTPKAQIPRKPEVHRQPAVAIPVIEVVSS